jgi:hypothetical protein
LLRAADRSESFHCKLLQLPSLCLHLLAGLSQTSAAVAAVADALRLMIDALSRTSLHTPVDQFDWSQQYLHQEELYGLEGRPITSSSSSSGASATSGTVDGNEVQQQRHFGPQWVLLKFDQPVTAPEVCLTSH